MPGNGGWPDGGAGGVAGVATSTLGASLLGRETVFAGTVSDASEVTGRGAAFNGSECPELVVGGLG